MRSYGVITKSTLNRMIRHWFVCMIPVVTGLGLGPLSSVSAETDPSLYPYQESIDYNKDGVITEGDLARASQNPVADLVSLPIQSNVSFLENTGDLIYNLNLQPVIPFSLNKDWSLITRTIIPVFALEDPPPSFDKVGLGDVNTSLFFSPVNSGKLIWGFGPVLSLPTATRENFGSGQWVAGPSFVGLTIQGPWVVGGLVSNSWSFAGDTDRDPINFFLAQPFITYNLEGGWFLSSSPIITADWTAEAGDQWTVPVGGGFGRVFPLNGQPVNMSLQGFYNVARPNNGSEWSIRYSLSLLFPR